MKPGDVMPERTKEVFLQSVACITSEILKMKHFKTLKF